MEQIVLNVLKHYSPGDSSRSGFNS